MKKLLCAFEVKTSGWNEKFEKFEEKFCICQKPFNVEAKKTKMDFYVKQNLAPQKIIYFRKNKTYFKIK